MAAGSLREQVRPWQVIVQKQEVDSVVDKQTDAEPYFSTKMNMRAGGKSFGEFHTANSSYRCSAENVC